MDQVLLGSQERSGAAIASKQRLLVRQPVAQSSESHSDDGNAEPYSGKHKRLLRRAKQAKPFDT
jgi:hypothetical protein